MQGSFKIIPITKLFKSLCAFSAKFTFIIVFYFSSVT